MISGKFWIKPGGELINVGGSEHAVWAKAHMLALPPRMVFCGPKLFDPLHPSKAMPALRRGAFGAAVRWLQDGHDPRIWMIEQHGWIRVKGNKFYVNPESLYLKAVRECADYWRAQSGKHDDDWVEFYHMQPQRIVLLKGMMVGDLIR